jgi:hypothetical protein
VPNGKAAFYKDSRSNLFFLSAIFAQQMRIKAGKTGTSFGMSDSEAMGAAAELFLSLAGKTSMTKKTRHRSGAKGGVPHVYAAKLYLPVRPPPGLLEFPG